MKQAIKYRAAVVLALLLLVLSGCRGESRAAAVMLDETSAREAVVVANPQSAVEEIYKSLKEYDASPIREWRLEEQLGIEESHITECYGRISNANSGLADVVIILPGESYREEVQLALSKYKEQRMAEFENYDILDAYSIAQSAVIYDQGNYVIMLMLADNDAARKIIDEYLPL